jgi:hypothetical protein
MSLNYFAMKVPTSAATAAFVLWGLLHVATPVGLPRSLISLSNLRTVGRALAAFQLQV